MRELLSYNAEAPLAEAATIPSAWYTDARIYEMELGTLFRDTWQYLAPLQKLRRAGDYASAQVASEPLLAIRGQDETLRVLSNVCRHRAGPLVTEPFGSTKMLRCGYHGWTYRLDGKLSSAAEFDGVRNFDKSSVCLPQIRAQEVGPFLFVNLSATAADCNWPGLLESMTPFQIDHCQHAARVVYEVGCNWKVYVDNYLDGGYHVAHVHPSLNGVLNYREYRCDLHENWNVQHAPMKSGSEFDDVRQGTAAHYYWLFPNFMINCYQGVIDTNYVLPLSVDRCAVIFDFFFDPQKMGTDFVEKSMQASSQVQEEDRHICEAVQRGLRSATYDVGRFSVRRENGGHQFHQLLGRQLQAKR